MIIDFFYLTPIFETKGSESFILPITPWPAEGEKESILKFEIK